MQITATFETAEEFLAFMSGKLPINNETRQRMISLDIIHDATKNGATLREVPEMKDVPTRVAVAPAPVAADPAPTPAPAAVPTSTTTYSLDDIRKAAADLMAAGKTADLQALLQKYQVAKVSNLAADQLGAFATDLRSMGASI